jgi:hypothetical protein
MGVRGSILSAFDLRVGIKKTYRERGHAVRRYRRM